jgi:hypothetical protein
MADPYTVSPEGFFWQHPTRPLDVRVGGVISNWISSGTPACFLRA